MIRYHGGPLGGPVQYLSRFYAGRHAPVSYAAKLDKPAHRYQRAGVIADQIEACPGADAWRAELPAKAAG
jgi:hypothetical protein